MATKLKRQLKRDNRLVFDLSDEELERFNERFSIYRSANRSDFIRDSILNNYIVVNDDTNLRTLVYEINRIGNNINQLTRLANKTKNIRSEEIKYLNKQVKDVRSFVYQSLMKHNEKR